MRTCASIEGAVLPLLLLLLLLLTALPITTEASGLYGCFPDVAIMGLTDNGNLICRDTYAPGRLPRYVSCLTYNVLNSSHCDRACDYYSACVGFKTPTTTSECTLCFANTSATASVVLNLKFQQRGCPREAISFYNADHGPTRLAEGTVTVRQTCSNLESLTDAYGAPLYCNAIVTFEGGIFPIVYTAVVGPGNYTPPIRFEFDIYRSNSPPIVQMLVPSFVLAACVLLVWWRAARVETTAA